MIAGLAIPALILQVFVTTNGQTTTGKTGVQTPPATVSAAQPTKQAQTAVSPTAAPTTPSAATKPASPQATATKPNDQGNYQVERIEVPAGRMVYLLFDLPENNSLEGYFEVNGNNPVITFWATDHTGSSIIAKKDYSGRGEFTIAAKKAGQYTLYLDNSKSAGSSRQVTVYYRLKSN
jgi:hypothetical protein